MDCARGPPAVRCYGTRFRPLGVVGDASSRKDLYSYSYSGSHRLACRTRQHDSSCIISIPSYCGSSSSSSSSSSSGSSGLGGGGAKLAGAVACVDRAQQQQSKDEAGVGAGADAVFLFLLTLMPPLAAVSAIFKIVSCRLLCWLAIVGWQWRHRGQLCRQHRCRAPIATRTFFSSFVIFLFAALPHILTSLLYYFGGVACRIWFTSSANTPKIMMGRKFTFSSVFFFLLLSQTLYCLY